MSALRYVADENLNERLVLAFLRRVSDLVLIAELGTPGDARDRVVFLPLED